MSTSSLKTLRDAIKRRSFDGAYFVWGEDDYQKDDAIRQLIEAALDPGARDFNLDTRRSAEVDAETLGVLLSTPPMMAERRVIVLRDVATLKKDARKILDEYLGRPAPDLLLIITGAAGSKPDTTLLASSTSLQFDPLTGDRIPRWITHRVTSELGLTITESAIELLDAVADRNAPRALGLISHVLAQSKTTGVSIVMALSTQMLAISWGRARLDEGLPRARLAQEYFDLLRETGAFTGWPWGCG